VGRHSAASPFSASSRFRFSVAGKSGSDATFRRLKFVATQPKIPNRGAGLFQGRAPIDWRPIDGKYFPELQPRRFRAGCPQRCGVAANPYPGGGVKIALTFGGRVGHCW
jgi:hypothetical protein